MSLHYSIYTVGGTHIVEAFEYDSGYTSVGKFKFTPKDLLGEAGTGSTISLKNLVADGYVFQNVALSNLWKENNQQTNWTDLTELNEFLEATVHSGTTINEINDIGDVNITKPQTNTDIKLSVLVYDASIDKVVLGPAYTLPGSGAPPPEGFSSFFTDQDLSTISGIEFKQNSNTLKINTTSSITQSAKLMVGGNIVSTGKVFFKNMFSDVSDLPSATTYHGMFAHVHATGAAYFAHGGSWVRLANQSEVFDGDYNSLSNLPVLFDGSYSSLSNIPTTFTPSAHNQAWSTITGTPTTISGYGITDAFNGSYTSLSNIPSTFTPSAHTHTASEITDFDAEVSNNTDVAANTIKVGYTDAAVDSRIAAASIDDLSDVDTSTVAPTDGQALVWDNTNSKWEPGTVSGGGGSSQWTTTGSDIYYTTGNVGIGTSSPGVALDIAGQINAVSSTFPVLGFTRETTFTSGAFNSTAGIASAMELTTKTSGDMGDGFGGGIVFTINDAAQTSTTNYVARIYARRDGADDTGALQFFTGADGNDPSMIIRGSGNVGIGTTTPAEALHVDGSAQVGTATLRSGSTNLSFTNYTSGGSGRVTIGVGARSDIAGNDAVAIGYNVARSRAGTFNQDVLIGARAGQYMRTLGSVGVGYGALIGSNGVSTTAGQNSVAIGTLALSGDATSTFTNTVAVGYEALKALTTGTGNTAVGYQAGLALTTAAGNTFLGNSAGKAVNTGAYNVAIGLSALDGVTNGTNNIAVGVNALGTSNSGNSIAIGRDAIGNAASSSSIGIGTSAGRYSTGGNNVNIGFEAGQGVNGTSTFGSTVAVGYQALTALTTGFGNTAVGYQASDAVTNAGQNTSLGYRALSGATTGGHNTAIGYQALLVANGTNNVAIGSGAGGSITTGGANIIIGREAGSRVTTAQGNTFQGFAAGKYTTGLNNTMIGRSSGIGSDGVSNYEYAVGIGYGAFNSLTTGDDGVAIGRDAAAAATSPTGVVAIGSQALTALTTGAGNTAVGYQAGDSLTTGSNNTLIGYVAGQALTTGSDNVEIGKLDFITGAINTSSRVRIGSDAGLGGSSVAIGHGPGRNSTSGNSTAIGKNALFSGSGGQNIAIGVEAANLFGGGQYNVYMGHRQGKSTSGSSYNVSLGGNTLSNGDNNVIIGYQAGASLTTASDGNVLLGYQAGNAETGSNKLYIENSSSTTPLIYGEFDNDILRVNGTLQVNDPSSTGYAFPTATGTLGQVLEVDANGDLVFATPSGGGGGTPLASADQTLTADRTIDTNGFNLDIELDSTGTADTFTIHDGTHDLFQVDTGTTGVLFSVNDVSGLPKLEVDEDEGVIAKSIKVDDGALTVAGQYGKGAEIWYQGTSTPTAGSVYYLDSSGNWANTDASAVATAKGMLSVSAGADSDVDGMVIKGFVYVGTDPGGSVGDVVYLSEAANQLTTTAPTTASAVVRVCGYKVGTNIVYFDPSKDWIELS